jgi:uncharacterized protein (DUF433 family)
MRVAVVEMIDNGMTKNIFLDDYTQAEQSKIVIFYTKSRKFDITIYDDED